PIGRPIANTQIYLLDPHGQPVPIGVPGELHIGGVGLARGYLNRPDLTQEKFIANPFSSQAGARLYKTGDLARYLPDGNIEYLGRLDHQVKIRGFRIELGEIEAVLAQHLQVREAIVMVREERPGDKRLVAYLVLNSYQQVPPTRDELRHFLKQKLPEYMVPSAFVVLESLPLTPNGKIDRRALPAPDSASSGREAGLVLPRTPLEATLAAIWAEILKLDQVGIHDNFFELGGHSLLATQVISRVREAFSVEVPLRSLFEFSTIAELSEQIKASGQGSSGLRPSNIEPVSRTKDLPLSFAQQRLWFLDQLEGGRSTYNMPVAVRLSGCLNVSALEQAVLEIVRRHEVLRTTFETVKGLPVQVINPHSVVRVQRVDRQALPQDAQFAEVQRLVVEENRRPFDLVNGPLVRVILLQLAPESYVLLLTMHHIISDGWSISIFIHELSTLYPAFCAGELSPLSELPIQYADFADWQRQWLTGEVLETQLNYWKQQLTGAPPVLELPADRPRPPVQTFRGSSQSFVLSADLMQQLNRLSQQSGVTLFMTLLAAFATFLSRYGGLEDIVVGSPIANRNRREIESLIGFFVNTLVLRTQLQGNPTFLELLTQVRQVALEAYAYQEVPFEQLVEALQPERNLSHTPLFQVMFVLQNAPLGQLELPGLTLELMELESVTAKFDLTLSMKESEQGLKGVWEYNSDLFEAETIERMTGHFQTLLEGIAAQPQQRIGDLAWLTSAECHQVLVEWNQTQVDYGSVWCIHQLFEAQVERTPQAIAVEFEGQQLTYEQLNVRANQLARYLQRLGVGPEVLVGICVERSLEMVVGLLGILKAGGAYVPLDPTYPPERLAFMLADAQVSVLVTQRALLERLPEPQAQLVCLDEDEGASAIAEFSPLNLFTPVREDNLAYVIYTSGSTGQPKGVLVAHQGLANLLEFQTQTFEVCPGNRFLQFVSLSFDVATSDVFTALCAGATLCLTTKDSLLPGSVLIQTLRDQAITHVELPVSVLAALPFEELPKLQTIIVGGEACSSELVAQWAPNRRFFNAYGPTEATVCATVTRCTDGNRQPPIGRPIANTQIYLLDPHGQPVPIGVPGELHIGGVGLARGYLN
ncbi:MAG: amino acid adenylation domain-containing protein, partial [Microcystaceae cyanobacterium]